MTHEEIKKALKDRGLSFSALAQASGRTYQSLSTCSQRKCISKPAATIVAAGLGMDVVDVFPDVEQYKNPARNESAASSLAKAKKVLEAADIRVA